MKKTAITKTFFRRWQIILLILIVTNLKLYAQTFYIDSQNGNDSNNGSSPTLAWKSLSKINGTTFAPGAKILFKADGIWFGQLWPKGSGAAGNPVIIDMYGAGNKPVINGNGLTGGGVIQLQNQSYWEINNLEIINKAAQEGDRLGVKIIGSNSLTNRHIHLKNLSIHDITGFYTFEMKGKNTGGIGIRITGGGASTRFDDILIEKCEIYNVIRVGITSQTIYANARGNQPITNLVIRNNSIHHCAGDGVIIRATDKALIEYNVAYENHNASEGLVSYGVALWCRSADNTIFQYNEVYNTRGGLDGQAFDADLESYKTVIQYNYSHDNEGGFMLVYGTSSESEVRYNISENDGKIGNHIFDFPEWSPPRGSARIYNNTIYIPAGMNPVIADQAVSTSSFYNNIIYNYGNGAPNVPSGGQTAKWDYNCYFGNANKPADPHLITTDPLLTAPGTGGTGMNTVGGYKLKTGSPALNSGMIITNNGGKDFFGNAVTGDKAPHRGAFNGAAIGNPPNADFTANNKNVCVNQTVTFSDASTNQPVTYEWTFGDGALPLKATGKGPHQVTYSTAGTKTIVLKVTNDAGSDIETKTGFITVNALPTTSEITGNAEVCNNTQNETYSVINSFGSTYTWTVPAGVLINSGTGTNLIRVNWNDQPGIISVQETNAAGCKGNIITKEVKTKICTTSKTISFTPTQDAYVRDGAYANTAFGVTDPLLLTTKNSGNGNNGYNREVLLMFDLSTFSGNIQEANINIFSEGAAGIEVSAYSNSIGDWNENTVTWNNKPDKSINIGTVVVTAAGFYKINISDFVKTAINNGRKKISVSLVNNTISVPQLNFYSKESNTNKPFLSITYLPVSNNILPCTKDAYVRDGSYSATTLGSTDPLKMQTKNTGILNDGFNREAYLTFNISGYDGISNVSLKIFGGFDAGDPLTTGVFEVTDNNWSETAINWNNKPTVNTIQINTTTVNAGAAAYHTWDVTSVVKTAKSKGATLITFCLRNTSKVANGSQINWNTKETGENPPVLEMSQNTATRLSMVNSELNLISVQPNPAVSEILINFPESMTEAGKIVITNFEGQIRIEEEYNQVQEKVIDVSSLTPGLYVVQIYSGEQRKSVKFMKQ